MGVIFQIHSVFGEMILPVLIVLAAIYLTVTYKADAPRSPIARFFPVLVDIQVSLGLIYWIYLLLITSGKDGTVRKVFSQVSPLGSYVVSFKVPTEDELSRDFLWRVHRRTPGRGMIGIFNRSHYEDVLVVRVHNLVPEPVWRARYEQINAFERILTRGDTIVLKFFLHISKEEQEQRLREREADVTKSWKLSPGDWREREHWDSYMAAYEEALEQCSTDEAPWHIVPADRKWYRNYAVAQTVAATLRAYKDDWMAKLGRVGETRLAELAAMRAEQPAAALNGKKKKKR